MNNDAMSAAADILTVADVERRVAEVAAYASGEIRSPSRDAWAHWHEDDLYSDVLRAIAAGHPEPAALARAALKTLDLDFSRWYE